MDLSPRRLPALSLGLILIACFVLWQPLAGGLFLHTDDLPMFDVSRRLSQGEWRLLFSRHDVHVFPLYRLIRWYFDLHYPEAYSGVYWAAMLAHIGSVLLLYALSRRFFDSAWGAVTTAGLFAWHTLGALAFYVKAHGTYVLSLPFLLGAVYCALRYGATPGKKWAVGASVCLAAAVGVHSLVAATAIPGVVAGYYLLARRNREQGRDLAIWAACAAPVVLAAVFWVGSGGPGMVSTGPGFAAAWNNGPEPIVRLGKGLISTVLHFAFLVWHNDPGPAVVAGAALLFLALLVVLGNRPATRWILTSLALAVPPVYLAVTVRGLWPHAEPRYYYQGFLPVAVAAGAAVDEALRRFGQRRWFEPAVVVLLLIAAPFYYRNQSRILTDIKARHWRQGGVTRESMLGWAGFLDQAAARAREASTTFRLPYIWIMPGVPIADFLYACHPNGLEGVAALSLEETRPEDCERFREEVREIRRQPGLFRQVRLPRGLLDDDQDAAPAGRWISFRCPEPGW